jgi:hypothetical protein
MEQEVARMRLVRLASRIVIAGFVGVFASAAAAAGPSPGTLEGGAGISVSGGARLIASPRPDGTTLVTLRSREGDIVRMRSFAGKLGVPMVTFSGKVEGTWANGRRALLATTIYDNAATTTFVALDARSLQPLRTIRLRGSFAYDALSTDGRRLYVLQYANPLEEIRYAVRSIDLKTGRLDPGTIVDKTEPGEQMTGLPMARSIGTAGWVYTLYNGGSSHAFVHALDTRHRTARCLDLPWRGAAQDGLEDVRLAVDGNGMLTLRQPRVGVLARIDTRSFSVNVLRDPVPTS